MLVSEGKAHNFELVLLDRALDLRRSARLLAGPQAVTLDKACS